MARRFRFRLETVRRLRERALEAQRRVVAAAVRAVQAVDDRIARLSQEGRDVSTQARDSRRVGRLDTGLLRRQQYYQGWLVRKIGEFREELAVRQAELDRQRVKLVEAQRDLKVIEKLRERRWRRYLVEVAREEQLDHDEAAQQQFRRCKEGHREAVV